MAYVDQKQGPSPAGLAGTIVTQAAIGALVIAGLSVATGVAEPGEIIDTFDIPTVPPPLPEPEPLPEPKTTAEPKVQSDPPVTVPNPKLELSDEKSQSKTTTTIVDLPRLPVPIPQPEPLPIPAPPAPVATFDPVSAKPRNDPGRWLGDRDYKSSWARRELTGDAKFQLDISKTGAVTGCRILGSTGHSELDQATCSLVTKRAKFEPARGSNGEPVAGKFVSSVRWQLPR